MALSPQRARASIRELTPQQLRGELQNVANIEDAQLYTQVQQLKTQRQMVTLLVACVGSIAVYVIMRIVQIRSEYKDMIKYVDNSKWGGASGTSIALACVWPWYNTLFGPSSNKVFPLALRLAFYNTNYHKKMTSVDASTFLNCLWQVAEEDTGNSQANALDILCQTFKASGTWDCDKPCGPPTSFAQPLGYAVAGGALQGAAGGAGIGMAVHAIGTAAAATAGWGFIIGGAVIGVATSLWARNVQKQNDKARCEDQEYTQHCYRPPGACGS